MPIEQILVLMGVAVLASAAMAVGLSAAWFAGRRRADGAAASQLDIGRDREPAAFGTRTSTQEAGLESVRPGTYDRVVRVVSLMFLATVGGVVAVSRAYPDTEVAIYLLLAAGTLFVVFMQDLLPTGSIGQARYWIEAAFAVALLATLLGLTGGLHSPFFAGFLLLVGGAALSLEGFAPVLLALLAAAAYSVVGVLVSGPRGSASSIAAVVVFNVVALALLAYIASVAGREQRRSREAAIRLSRFDPLTGLYNRGYFFAALDRELRRAQRMGRTFAILMLDLDDLKPVNDTFGHLYGDRLLRSITEIIQRAVRATDTAGRYGGDEFVVLLPETDGQGANVVADKLRREVAALALRVDDRIIRTSVSLGLVAYPDDGASIEELMIAVDAALYEAKRRGKNQIVGYTTRTERVTTAIGGNRAGVRVERPRDEPGSGATGDSADWPAVFTVDDRGSR